ncbi:MAG: 2-phospho-L-lactate transferase [Candidatus Atabeyarchaeum deiterrae]
MLVTALSGGVGGAKLVLGLSKLLERGELVVVGNTGDDFDLFGLHISPDLDILMYTLAGIADEVNGWGVKDDTFNCLVALNENFGLEKWFNLGDKDLATHIYRTELLKGGYKLSRTTETLCSSLHANNVRIIPMTDDKVETLVKLQDGSIVHFEEYFVKRRSSEPITGVTYNGSESARPAKGVLESIARSDVIVVCPSNPIASIGPILSIKAIRKALSNTKSPVVAVSPIIGGMPLKGPADKFMRGLGLEVSALGVAKLYMDILTHFIIDDKDAPLKEAINSIGLSTIVTNTIMNTLEDKVRLARAILNLVQKS